jgi:hypothetical protein
MGKMFQARGRKMNGRIDDDMLERLISYEGYVEKLFAQAAHRRWLEMNADVVQDYEKLKTLKKRISSLVDLAFFRYGIENGLMKIGKNELGSDLNEDLETLATQLLRVDWDPSCPKNAESFAKVV